MTRLKCGCHESSRRYSEKYDAYYCANCNIWLEGICKSKSCSYCMDRPIKPTGEAEQEKK